jgi:hypothetical protein
LQGGYRVQGKGYCVASKGYRVLLASTGYCVASGGRYRQRKRASGQRSYPAQPATTGLPGDGYRVLATQQLHPQWIAGFTTGDGCLRISIRESKLYKAGSPVAILFILTQHIRDELLLKSFIDFFDCGHTYSYSYLNYIEFKCQSLKDNYEKILPFF